MGAKDKTSSNSSSDPKHQDAQGTPDSPVFVFPETKKKKGRRRGIIIAAAAVLVLLGILVLPGLLGGNKTSLASGAYTPYTVKRGDITVTLSGSGTLKPADSYTVTSLITGDILTASFEEGDVVTKNQVLYTVDSTDVNTGIKQAETSLGDSQNKLSSAMKQADNLNLKASGAGIVTKLSVDAGDTVQAGQTVAVIQDNGVMSLKAMFRRDLAQGFYIGQNATITFESSGETFNGSVSDIGTVDQVLTGNVIAREVKITVTNPGAFSSGQTAFATVAGQSCLQGGTLEYSYQGNVTATMSGTVASVGVKVGSKVSKGQIIAVLQNDSVDQQIQSAQTALDNAKLSLSSQSNKLTNYSIKSPIAGTIVEKNVKEGDKLQSGAVLCTVFDLSYLTLTLNVDELDIKKVQPGQTVTLTVAAAAGKEYSGIVKKVNIKGTTKNGVTSYPVIIEITKTDGLLPGMNVDAKIIVASLKGVLTVPVSAVQRNNFVLLKTADASTAKPAAPDLPAGYSQTEVTLGPSNDADIVITGGLKEGDVVAVKDNTPSSYDYNPFQRPASQSSKPSGGTAGSDTADDAPKSSAGASK